MKKRTLSIFQKMLVAPLAGVLLYSAYLFYIYDEQAAGHERVEQLRTFYLPVLERAGANVLLFDTITVNFRDAVLAGEEEWVRNTRKDKERIEASLTQLADYAPVIAAAEVAELQDSFQRYYDNAYTLALAMLQGGADAEANNRLIENVENYHGRASANFQRMHSELLGRFSQRIDEINARLQRQVVIAAALGIVMIIIIVGVTFVMSLSTRRSLQDINAAFRAMAQESPDFSRRLEHASHDELGELADWFNRLADKLEANYRQTEQLSITDKLTQLHNRRKIDELFHLALGKARRYGDPLTVIMLDIDHFKMVNDLAGHQVGDQVLCELAKVLRRNVRSTDHVGRWGGEEFIVLLPSTELAQGRQLAEKLRAAIASHEFPVVGHKTGSFGTASYREGDDEEALTRRTDACLYAAKKQGRNRVIDETSL